METPISNEIPSSSSKKISLEFNPKELISNPGLRPPIASYDVNECDKIRRAYLSKPPCKPKGHAFPYMDFGGKRRHFNSAWFSEYEEWLEYSVEKDATFCLYCYLFPEIGVDPTFVTRGFTYLKDPKRLHNHQGLHDSHHNVAKQKCIALKTER